jgi:hypothetical protein
MKYSLFIMIYLSILCPKAWSQEGCQFLLKVSAVSPKHKKVIRQDYYPYPVKNFDSGPTLLLPHISKRADWCKKNVCQLKLKAINSIKKEILKKKFPYTLNKEKTYFSPVKEEIIEKILTESVSQKTEWIELSLMEKETIHCQIKIEYQKGH